MRGITALVAALALAVCAAVGAHAGPGAATAQDGDAVLAHAAAVASAHWPDSRCNGRESVVWTPQAELDADHPGEAVAADASPPHCSVRLPKLPGAGRAR